MASGRLVAAAIRPTPRHTIASAKCAKVTHIQRYPPFSTEVVSPTTTTRVKVKNAITTREKCERILILGGGIAGLSTARYLLDHAQQNDKRVQITLIDANTDFLPTIHTLPSNQPSTNERLHKNIPSRRNGNVLCPSLTVPWTNRSLWNEAILPGIKSVLVSSTEPSPSVTFDWPSLVTDKDMVRPTCRSVFPYAKMMMMMSVV